MKFFQVKFLIMSHSVGRGPALLLAFWPSSTGATIPFQWRKCTHLKYWRLRYIVNNRDDTIPRYQLDI